MSLNDAMSQAAVTLDALAEKEIDYGMFLSCLERERRFRNQRSVDPFEKRSEIVEALAEQGHFKLSKLHEAWTEALSEDVGEARLEELTAAFKTLGLDVEQARLTRKGG